MSGLPRAYPIPLPRFGRPPPQGHPLPSTYSYSACSIGGQWKRNLALLSEKVMPTSGRVLLRISHQRLRGQQEAAQCLVGLPPDAEAEDRPFSPHIHGQALLLPPTSPLADYCNARLQQWLSQQGREVIGCWGQLLASLQAGWRCCRREPLAPRTTPHVRMSAILEMVRTTSRRPRTSATSPLSSTTHCHQSERLSTTSTCSTAAREKTAPQSGMVAALTCEQ